MNKTEFLEILREQLSGQMQEAKIASNVRYYRDYIDTQERNGRSEAEVMAELGDPRLIAKTLVDTDPEAGQEIYEESDPGYDDRGYSTYGYGGQDEGASFYEEADDETNFEDSGRSRIYHLDLNTWYGKLLAAAVVILFLAVLFFLLRLLLPVALVLILAGILISWFRRRM